MSLREEDKQKTSSSGRSLGLGLAAAAIGVGIGAAFYYVFSKEEAPDKEGSTSVFHEELNSSNDYTKVSEHTTTDTSMNEESQNSSNSTDEEECETQYTNNSSSSSSSHDETMPASSVSDSNHDSNWSTGDSTEWEVDTSLELPHYNPPSHNPVFYWSNRLFSGRPDRNRERTRSLEECSICFEVILKNQEVMTLSCNHKFHQSCILTWLDEQPTCPNCRKFCRLAY